MSVEHAVETEVGHGRRSSGLVLSGDQELRSSRVQRQGVRSAAALEGRRWERVAVARGTPESGFRYVEVVVAFLRLDRRDVYDVAASCSSAVVVVVVDQRSAFALGRVGSEEVFQLRSLSLQSLNLLLQAVSFVLQGFRLLENVRSSNQNSYN